MDTYSWLFFILALVPIGPVLGVVERCKSLVSDTRIKIHNRVQLSEMARAKRPREAKRY